MIPHHTISLIVPYFDVSNEVSKGMEALDGAASANERLDLEFADGLKMIATYVDEHARGQDLIDISRSSNDGVAARDSSMSSVIFVRARR